MKCSRNDNPAKYLRKVASFAVKNGESEEKFVGAFLEPFKNAARNAFRNALKRKGNICQRIENQSAVRQS